MTYPRQMNLIQMCLNFSQSHFQILQALRRKGVHDGHYAVVQLRVPNQHEVLILIMR